MEKRIKSILIFSILTIVFYINADNKINEHIINLIYYSQFYILVGFLIVGLWILFKDKVIRILTVPIGIYYLYHFAVNFIEIFNPVLKDAIYRTRYINYGLSITLAIALIVSFIVSRHKRKKNEKICDG